MRPEINAELECSTSANYNLVLHGTIEYVYITILTESQKSKDFSMGSVWGDYILKDMKQQHPQLEEWSTCFATTLQVLNPWIGWVKKAKTTASVISNFYKYFYENAELLTLINNFTSGTNYFANTYTVIHVILRLLNWFRG